MRLPVAVARSGKIEKEEEEAAQEARMRAKCAIFLSFSVALYSLSQPKSERPNTSQMRSLQRFMSQRLLELNTVHSREQVNTLADTFSS